VIYKKHKWGKVASWGTGREQKGGFIFGGGGGGRLGKSGGLEKFSAREKLKKQKEEIRDRTSCTLYARPPL